jgi:predicted O-methyltransferase YrrM
MAVSLDQEQNEVKAFFELAGDLSSQRVLEIGSGEGRLTWRFAPQAAQVIAIEPESKKLDLAQQNLPPELSDRVAFHAIGLEEFALQYPPGAAPPFDLVLLSWSL